MSQQGFLYALWLLFAIGAALVLSGIATLLLTIRPAAPIPLLVTGGLISVLSLVAIRRQKKAPPV